MFLLCQILLVNQNKRVAIRHTLDKLKDQLSLQDKLKDQFTHPAANRHQQGDNNHTLVVVNQ
jgi:hypothetical protein